jgi:hypothetical protein
MDRARRAAREKHAFEAAGMGATGFWPDIADRDDPGAGGSGVMALPSLGELDRSTALRIWLASEPADMRYGFDRLAELAGHRRGSAVKRQLIPWRWRVRGGGWILAWAIPGGA